MKAAPLLVLAMAGCATLPAALDDPATLAAAESAFAAHSVREDMRAAFIAHFAPDGLFVRDGWTAARAWLEPRPAPPVVLDWRPVHVEVAGSGELGLSTGPWKLTPRDKPDAPPAHGQFVSIWRREAASPWRVLVDLGIGHPGAALWGAPLAARVTRATHAATPLADAEERFQRLARSDARAAYRAFAASDVRFYRDGHAPAIGRDLVAAALATPAPASWRVEEVRTAASNDFGFTRGSVSAADGEPASGYFVRVWRHQPAGWRIALDVVQPAPKR
jgi:ketosteroid isomerase-like protein